MQNQNSIHVSFRFEAGFYVYYAVLKLYASKNDLWYETETQGFVNARNYSINKATYQALEVYFFVQWFLMNLF